MKTVVIAQPTYLPWMGYFYLIQESDVFVFLDSVQFEKQSWQCRNKIKGPNGEIILTVPIVRNRLDQNIKDVKINNSFDWQRKHHESIRASYANALHFKEYRGFLEKIYKNEWNLISQLNMEIIKHITNILGFKTEFLQSSDMQAKGKATELVVNICKEVGADRYIASAGARVYMKPHEHLFKDCGIKLEYLDYKHPVYPQRFGDFIPHLSVIDVMLNCGKDSRDLIIQGGSCVSY